MEDYIYIHKIKNGDQNAASCLFEKYYDRVYHYCYRRVLNQEAAQDLTQDTFIRVISSIDTYKDYGKFENYLYVIAGNLCKNYYKKMQSMPIPFEDVEITDTDDLNSKEEAIVVRQALEGLEEIEREIILLRFYQELKIKDVARILGINLSTTKYHLKKGLDELKNILSEDNKGGRA